MSRKREKNGRGRVKYQAMQEGIRRGDLLPPVTLASASKGDFHCVDAEVEEEKDTTDQYPHRNFPTGETKTGVFKKKTSALRSVGLRPEVVKQEPEEPGLRCCKGDAGALGHGVDVAPANRMYGLGAGAR